MPVSYRIDPVEKIVFTTLEGEIDDAQIAGHASAMRDDPEIDGSFVELMHADTTSMKGVTSSGLLTIAAALENSTGPSKLAIVASKDIEFGLARMVESLADDSPIEIEVFRDQADAKDWLGIK